MRIKTLDEGWPEEGSYQRTLLDELYWGWHGLDPDYTRVQQHDYLMPRMLNATGQGLATYRNGYDQPTDRVTSFVRGWRQWRRRGVSVERRRARGTIEVKRSYRTDAPAPTTVATWVGLDTRRMRRSATVEVRDHGYPRPR